MSLPSDPSISVLTDLFTVQPECVTAERALLLHAFTENENTKVIAKNQKKKKKFSHFIITYTVMWRLPLSTAGYPSAQMGPAVSQQPYPGNYTIIQPSVVVVGGCPACRWGHTHTHILQCVIEGNSYHMTFSRPTCSVHNNTKVINIHSEFIHRSCDSHNVRIAEFTDGRGGWGQWLMKLITLTTPSCRCWRARG